MIYRFIDGVCLWLSKHPTWHAMILTALYLFALIAVIEIVKDFLEKT